jgi:hypothetical protein
VEDPILPEGKRSRSASSIDRVALARARMAMPAAFLISMSLRLSAVSPGRTCMKVSSCGRD